MAMDNINWDEQPLGKISDEELAKNLGISKNTVLRQRKKRGVVPFGKPHIKANVDWDAQPLGEVPDAVLAQRLGLVEVYGEYNARAIIGRHRRKRGIPSFIPDNRRNIDWDNEPLGELPDKVLARKLGCSSQAVAEQRRKRNISSVIRIVVNLPKDVYEKLNEPEKWLAKELISRARNG